MKIHEIVQEFTADQLKDISDVLLTFIHGFRPGGQELDWLLEFQTQYDSVLIFKWAGFIDQIIGVPFPSSMYRDRAHHFGELLQKRFDKEELGIVLVHPLFIYVGLFCQILKQSSLIYISYRDEAEKVETVLKLDYYLQHKVLIDHSSKIFVLIPGFGDLYDVLLHILDMDVIDIEKITIFQSKLEFPVPIQKEKTEVNLYYNLAKTHNENSDHITYRYH